MIMKILLCLSLVFVVRLALASEFVYDEEMKRLQLMNDGNGGDQENDEEVFGIEPTKHPFKVHYIRKKENCLDAFSHLEHNIYIRI